IRIGFSCAQADCPTTATIASAAVAAAKPIELRLIMTSQITWPPDSKRLVLLVVTSLSRASPPPLGSRGRPLLFAHCQATCNGPDEPWRLTVDRDGGRSLKWERRACDSEKRSGSRESVFVKKLFTFAPNTPGCSGYLGDGDVETGWGRSDASTDDEASGRRR